MAYLFNGFDAIAQQIEQLRGQPPTMAVLAASQLFFLSTTEDSAFSYFELDAALEGLEARVCHRDGVVVASVGWPAEEGPYVALAEFEDAAQVVEWVLAVGRMNPRYPRYPATS